MRFRRVVGRCGIGFTANPVPLCPPVGKRSEFLLWSAGSDVENFPFEYKNSSRVPSLQPDLDPFRHKTAALSCVPGNLFLFQDPQLGVVQHDLFFAVLLKFYGCDWVVFRTFHFDHFAKTEFLVFHPLANLQVRCVTCHEIG